MKEKETEENERMKWRKKCKWTCESWHRQPPFAKASVWFQFGSGYKGLVRVHGESYPNPIPNATSSIRKASGKRTQAGCRKVEKLRAPYLDTGYTHWQKRRGEYISKRAR